MWEMSMKPCYLLLKALLCITLGHTMAYCVDFTIAVSGPTHVTQGRALLVLAQASIVSGVDDEPATPTVSGLPPQASVEFVNLKKYCCGTFLWRITQANPLRITTAQTTPTGRYPITITYVSQTGVTRTGSFTLTVVPNPTVAPPPRLSKPPVLETVELWESNMTNYGKLHCNPAALNMWEGNVWYYDGIRNYMQISKTTGDEYWLSCAELQISLYRQYVIVNNGLIPGWRVFPHGLAMHFQKTQDPTSRSAVVKLADGNAIRYDNLAWSISWQSSREISYALSTLVMAEQMGFARRPEFNDYVELLFGHFDQWFVSQNASYVQPFMVALAAESLIDYWSLTKDPRVLPILRIAADKLWSKSWSDSDRAFIYYNEDGSSGPAADLNLLIAPLYGWVYQYTGVADYREKGDQVFNSGVRNAWLGGGKQFSQSYRWSGKYVEWRTPTGVGRRK